MKDIKKSQANDDVKVINGRKVKVARRKRRSNLLTYCALAVALFTSLGLVVSLCFLFDLEEVEVSGVTLYTNEQIVTVGGVESGANLVRTDTDVIEKRLLDTLPYLKTVSVSKDYPHSLKITVTEERKCADIELYGKFYVIAESGKILEAGNAFHDLTLPLITGFDLKEPELRDNVKSEDELKPKVLMQLLEAIERSGLDKITAIDMTERTDLVAVYDNRIKLRIGSSIDLEYKFTCMKSVIEQKLTSDFEGTLKYNNAKTGVSAFSKDAEAALEARTPPKVTVPPADETAEQVTASSDWQTTTASSWQTTEPAPADDYGWQTTTTTAVPYQAEEIPQQTTTQTAPAAGYTGWQT